MMYRNLAIPPFKILVILPHELPTDGSDDTANDLLLAQMLQLEFDKENDAYVKSLEKTYNGTSKGWC